MAQQRRRGKKPGCWVRKSFYVSAEYKSFKTYQELKKNLKSLIEENTVDDNEVTITRTRRGEWLRTLGEKSEGKKGCKAGAGGMVWLAKEANSNRTEQR